MPRVREQDTDRAEVFDALGHPTRISILKLLSHEALSFADLKKKTDIESSGHLQHHLTKLDGLIKTDEHGNYRLSDTGNDALFVMRTVETVSRKGRRRLRPYSRKSRMLLSTIVVVLAAILVVSTWHLSNVNFGLHENALQALDIAHTQYATNLTQFAAEYSEYAAQVQNIAQNQYVCDVMTGSLWESGRMSAWSMLRELPPQEWFNFTAVVISELNDTGQGYGYSNCATIVLPPPERNDTYYRQGFVGYGLTIYGPNGGDWYQSQTYPVIGPDGWDGQVVGLIREEIPPYPTVQTSGSSRAFSGGFQTKFTTFVPIATFGNYTFCLRNEGNTTMQVSWTLTAPLVTLETRPLQVGDYPAWSPRFAKERIVRIRQQSERLPAKPSLPPTTSPSLPLLSDTAITAFNATTLAILSTTILAGFSVLIINRRKI